MSKIELRSRMVLSLFSVLSFLMVCAVIYNTGLLPLPGRSEKAIEEKAAIIADRQIQQTIEGTIKDRNGVILSEASEPGVAATLLYPNETSVILGYNSKIYGLTGLRQKYATSLLNGGKDSKGGSMRLSMDVGLQRSIYELLDGKKGSSCAVMDNRTGEILAIVSRGESDFDANLIDTKFNDYSKEPKLFLNRATLAEHAPGSTFKLITASALIEEGEGDYTINDNGTFMGISNASGAVYGHTDLQKALTKSVNTYFASAGAHLGGVAIERQAVKFCYDRKIECDVGILDAKLGLGVNVYDDTLAAQTAFGQGRIQTSPMHILLSLHAIVNDGKMMKPYIVQTMENDDKVIFEAKPSILEEHVVSQDSSETLKSMLLEVGKSYGFNTDVYAKTGTAQLGPQKGNHIYLVFGTEDFTAIISEDETTNASKSLVPLSKKILDCCAHIYAEQKEAE